MTAADPTDTGCMHLERTGPSGFQWCGRQVDERSDPATPRCTDHLTPDTTQREQP